MRELERIRFTSSHPLDFSDELIECYAPVRKAAWRAWLRICIFLFKADRTGFYRRWDAITKIENYFAQMDRLREFNPDVGLSTDLIVGFPTETDEDFQATLSFSIVFSSTISMRLLILRGQARARRSSQMTCPTTSRMNA